MMMLLRMLKCVANVLNQLKPVILMVLLQVAFIAGNIFYKFAINDEMSVNVLTTYRLAFGAVFIVPLVPIFERNKRPKMTWRLFFMSFLCGLFGDTLINNVFDMEQRNKNPKAP
ncbi:hypothetical protein PIB30_048288 [Stylosanthes scabra]|uniref:WAT1-related protein n=1 Tax=Stylosanthes scabra TaxID=79078 RepID=A0ABU6UJT0_9FABA|nr:hypothetical protein [Stylosanthes scabra]